MARKTVVLTLAAIVGGLISLFGAPSLAAATDCVALPAQSQASVQIAVSKSATYRLWLRQSSQTSGINDIVMAVDSTCGIAMAKNTQAGTLAWIGTSNQNQPLLFSLAAGQHTVVLAGDQTTIGIDVGIFTNDVNCTPVDQGNNCPVTVIQPAKKTPHPLTVNQTAVSHTKSALAIAAAIALGVVVAFLVWHYIGFFRSKVLPALGISNAPFRHKAKHAVSLAATKHYVNHHRLLVLICAGLIVALSILLSWSLVSAQENLANRFEVESAALQGGAKIVNDLQASGGAYVLMGETPAPAAAAKAPSASKKSSSQGSSSAGGAGSGSAQTAVCPAFPSFPDQNCTGWEHTGVTLRDCTDQTDNGYIWDDGVKNFDSCYFSKTLTVEGANVTIKRSQVHGTISTHWSHNYDFRNLTLEDVEIEDEGNSDAYLAAIGGHNFSCLRCDVHHTGSGIHIGNNAVVQDSYTHDFNYTQDAHGAGIGAGQGSGNNAQVIHNNIQCNRLAGQPTICSSALSLYDEPTIDNVLVENNLFNTTGGYCVYGGGTNGTNIKFIDNYFGKKFNPQCAVYGPVAVFYSANAGNVWTGNKWQDGSGDVPPSN